MGEERDYSQEPGADRISSAETFSSEFGPVSPATGSMRRWAWPREVAAPAGPWRKGVGEGDLADDRESGGRGIQAPEADAALVVECGCAKKVQSLCEIPFGQRHHRRGRAEDSDKTHAVRSSAWEEKGPPFPGGPR